MLSHHGIIYWCALNSAKRKKKEFFGTTSSFKGMNILDIDRSMKVPFNNIFPKIHIPLPTTRIMVRVSDAIIVYHSCDNASKYIYPWVPHGSISGKKPYRIKNYDCISATTIRNPIPLFDICTNTGSKEKDIMSE